MSSVTRTLLELRVQEVDVGSEDSGVLRVRNLLSAAKEWTQERRIKVRRHGITRSILRILCLSSRYVGLVDRLKESDSSCFRSAINRIVRIVEDAHFLASRSLNATRRL